MRCTGDMIVCQAVTIHIEHSQAQRHAASARVSLGPSLPYIARPLVVIELCPDRALTVNLVIFLARTKL